MKKAKLFNQSIPMIIIVILVCCLILMILPMLNLPEISVWQAQIRSHRSSNIVDSDSKGKKLGKFGEMMVEMLPDDLVFTVFVPSGRAFEKDLRLRESNNITQKELDDTYATVSRVLGFSATPFKIYADSVPIGKEISFDSISGFTLYISKDLDGVLVVNQVRSQRVDIKRGEVVVHMMNGVIMDAEFELSVRPDDDVEEEAE